MNWLEKNKQIDADNFLIIDFDLVKDFDDKVEVDSWLL